ncbi:hypothetical protein LMG3431_03805 [Achromobacter pestifer]|uniref:Uncharacterized protein n=1 Tax=Achromobacter pestifer TaxID=1353889 RepID=A0A6S6ZE32_9BURK|nr:hypothetical protein LMG3431_03805 [Achromobacter pestifer]
MFPSPASAGVCFRQFRTIVRIKILERNMWILIAVIAAGALAHLWRQWHVLARQLPDAAEHLVLF